jgi:hypothetical protein
MHKRATYLLHIQHRASGNNGRAWPGGRVRWGW